MERSSDIFARTPVSSLRCGAMQQIAEWLEKLGMPEYVQRFAENRIDLSVLPDLTDQDLEKLGVLLGDRRKMLRAIVNLEVTGKSAPAIAVAATASAVLVGLHDTAERRFGRFEGPSKRGGLHSMPTASGGSQIASLISDKRKRRALAR
jgi:hypothetical protein